MKLTVEHVKESIARGLHGCAHFDEAVWNIHGFATQAMRRMFSNLCRLEDLKYLEVGTYCGATFVSAFNNNPIHAIGIDNFSQTWSPGRDIKAEFVANKERFTNPITKSVNFFEGDCFNPELLSQIGPGVDIFYFDGDHTREAQAKALPHFFDLLANIFLFIVDDYNWPDVKNGTDDGLNAVASKITVIYSRILTGEIAQDDPVYHNGMALFLCRKL